MRTVDFSRILFDSIQLCGLDRDEITAATFSQMRDLANMRLKAAWEYDVFPQVMKFSEVTVLKDANSTPYFTLPADCGEIISVWSLNPVNTTRNAQITYLLNDDKAYLTAPKEGTVWVEYRKKVPELFGDAWDQPIEFKVGSQAYFDSGSLTGVFKPVKGKPYSGNFYNCKVNNVNKPCSQHSDEWEIVNIPYIFASYITRAVYADYLRSEGQVDSAQVAEAEAQAFLGEEIDKIARQQGQIRRINFINPYS
jgi:hypothetical protein